MEKRYKDRWAPVDHIAMKVVFLIALILYCPVGGAVMVAGGEAQLEVAEEQLQGGDYQALKAVRSSLVDLPGSSFFATWSFLRSGDEIYPCTSFTGLICDYVDGVLRVRQLNLGSGIADSPGLTGTLHPAIASLSALQQLTLSPGKVHGPLPHALGRLQELVFLGINRNQISGSIPPSLAFLRSLQTLDLSFNNLRGLLPASLLQLPSLQALLLSHNRLTGCIHPISSPLLRLDLQQNMLSGPLPSFLPPTLSVFSLAHNKISGNISALASLTSLDFLDLSFNKLTGDLPPALLGLDMHTLALQHNHLGGRIEPPSLVRVEILDLSYNNFWGEVSPLLSTVANLYLNNNRFQGQIPQEFADQLLSGELESLYLQHNLVTEFRLDPHVPLPVTASLCIDYNCMQDTPSQSHCPWATPLDKSMQDDQCGQADHVTP